MIIYSANKTAGTHRKGKLTIILWTISNVAKTASAEGSGADRVDECPSQLM